MEQEILQRIESNISKHADKLSELAVQTALNTASLEQHMAQTVAVKEIAQAAHAKIEPIAEHVEDVKKLLKFLKWVLGAMAAAYIGSLFK